jgi:hypothetical protein
MDSLGSGQLATESRCAGGDVKTDAVHPIGDSAGGLWGLHTGPIHTPSPRVAAAGRSRHSIDALKPRTSRQPGDAQTESNG